jgi:hypothetical protein
MLGRSRPYGQIERGKERRWRGAARKWEEHQSTELEKLWCEGALGCENAKSRLEYYYVKIGSDPYADATAFKLRSGCYISRCSGGHHAKVGVGHKAEYNPLLLLGYAQ